MELPTRYHRQLRLVKATNYESVDCPGWSVVFIIMRGLSTRRYDKPTVAPSDSVAISALACTLHNHDTSATGVWKCTLSAACCNSLSLALPQMLGRVRRRNNSSKSLAINDKHIRKSGLICYHFLEVRVLLRRIERYSSIPLVRTDARGPGLSEEYLEPRFGDIGRDSQGSGEDAVRTRVIEEKN